MRWVIMLHRWWRRKKFFFFNRKSERKITTWSRSRRRYTTRDVIYIVRYRMARIHPSQFTGQWKAVVKTVISQYATTLKHGYFPFWRSLIFLTYRKVSCNFRHFTSSRFYLLWSHSACRREWTYRNTLMCLISGPMFYLITCSSVSYSYMN